MRRNVWAGLVVAVMAVMCSGLAMAGLSECIDATCRVSVDTGSQYRTAGTGCAVGRLADTQVAQGSVLVLTNAHVVERAATAHCEFWVYGHKSKPLPGRVIARDSALDMAMIQISTSQFGGRLPSIVPLAPSGTVIRPGQTLLSVGCANGHWASAWRGHAVSLAGTELKFRPGPESGRSGSAIFDASGSYVVGLLRARNTDTVTSATLGIATNLGGLRQRFNTAYQLAQCPGGVCDPYQRQLQPSPSRQPSPQGGAWPSLPTPSPQPMQSAPVVVPPPVDLKPLEDKLDRIADLIIEIQTPPVMEAPLPEVPLPEAEPVDTAAMDTATSALQTSEQALRAAESVGQAAKEGLASANARIDKVDASIAATAADTDVAIQRIDDKNGNVIERLRARVDEAKANGAEGAREVARAVAKDVIVSHGGVVAGLFVLMGWFVYKDVKDKKETGDPLFIEKVIDRVRDRVRPDPPAPPAPPTPPAAP
jgi:hypothetical protein